MIFRIEIFSDKITAEYTMLNTVVVEQIKTVLTAPINLNAITKNIIVTPIPKNPTIDITEICSNEISNGISNNSIKVNDIIAPVHDMT